MDLRRGLVAVALAATVGLGGSPAAFAAPSAADTAVVRVMNLNMHRHAHSVRQVLRRHPWAVGLLESRTHPGPANLAHYEAVLANLFAAGLSPAEAVLAYNLLDSYVYGFALQEHTLPIADPEDLVEVAPEMLAQGAAGQYPHLARVATELVASGFRYGDEFVPGLDLILDGLERLPRTGSGSTKPRVRSVVAHGSSADVAAEAESPKG